MNNVNVFQLKKMEEFTPSWKVPFGVMILVIITSLVACSNKEKRPGQTLARVNGEEITILQINEELRRADIQIEQRDAATKQLLEALIDRQLIVEEAMRNRIHRTPEVMQAIERAKAQIIEQAYLKNVAANVSNPSTAEINDYFQKYPEYFSERKQFDIQQLIFATKDVNDELKFVMNSAKSLDAVASWLNNHNVRYSRGQFSRNTTDLPEQMIAKLKYMQKGNMFIVNEDKNTLLNFIYDIRSSPVTLKNASSQIEQYLIDKKTRQVVNDEIFHLRSLAKIEYQNLSETAPR